MLVSNCHLTLSLCYVRYAIRFLAPFWNTDVTGDFCTATCPKTVATDAADSIIADSASLKSGIALWKELRRGNIRTNEVGWILETPLHYRMADWENVCVTDSKYVSGKRLGRIQPPVWPADKHISVEEAFHFAACCTRIGKLAKAGRLLSSIATGEESGVEYDDRTGAFVTRNLILEAWKALACCDGLVGAPLGIAVKRGFDSTVAWLCATVVFGGQTVVSAAENRLRQKGPTLDSGPPEIIASDFDLRPPGFPEDENEEVVHPIPIPEVIGKLACCLEAGDETLARGKFRF